MEPSDQGVTNTVQIREASTTKMRKIIYFLEGSPNLICSHLGHWEAVVVEGVPLLLNLTLRATCGLIFGRMDTTR